MESQYAFLVVVRANVDNTPSMSIVSSGSLQVLRLLELSCFGFAGG